VNPGKTRCVNVTLGYRLNVRDVTYIHVMPVLEEDMYAHERSPGHCTNLNTIGF